MTAVPRGTEEIRRCAYTKCNAVLTQHPAEAPYRFRSRRTCGYHCCIAYRHEVIRKHTDEELETIRTLYGKITCEKLGELLHVSKNVVIGLYHRNFREVKVKTKAVFIPPVEFPRNGCLYAHGDPGISADFHFCGEPIEPGLAWCARHRAVVYQPEKPPEIKL